MFRRFAWVALMVSVGLHAQTSVVFTGTSLMRNGNLLKTTLGSVTVKAVSADALKGGDARVVTEKGAGTLIPCSVQIFPGTEGQPDQVIWSVAVPETTPLPLKTLEVFQETSRVAFLKQPVVPAPDLDLVEVPEEAGQTLAWVLKSKGTEAGTSYWMRLSKDGGQTWEGTGKLYSGETTEAQMTFDFATYGNPATALVEFWLAADLKVRVVRYQLGKGRLDGKK